MKFSCDYEALLGVLQDVASVVEGSLTSQDTQNVIFRFTSDGVQVIGYSPMVVYKRMLGDYMLSIDDEELGGAGVKYLQIRSRELLPFLNAYKGLKRTRVTGVSLETCRNGVMCTVSETPVLSQEDSDRIEALRVNNPDYEDPAEGKQILSHRVFTGVVIKPVIVQAIENKAPDADFVEMHSQNLSIHTSSLLGNMENSTSVYGTMMFTRDNVAILTKTMTTVMRNMTYKRSETGVFTDIALTYPVLSFIDKVVCRSEVFEVAKADNFIFFKTVDMEAFVVYKRDIVPFESQLSLFKKDSYVSVDRAYLKDVLKRLSLSNSTVEVTYSADKGALVLANDVFSQEIELLDCANMSSFDGMKFKIMPGVVSSALIGSESVFGSLETYIYYCRNDKSVNVAFADRTGAWFSLVRVKMY